MRFVVAQIGKWQNGQRRLSLNHGRYVGLMRFAVGEHEPGRSTHQERHERNHCRSEPGGAPCTWHHPPRQCTIALHAVYRHRLDDVLHPPLAHRLETEGELLLDLLRYFARHPDAAGFGKLLQAGGDVDAFAIAVISLDDDLAQIYADPDPDMLGFRQIGVTLGQGMLQGDRAFDRVHDRAELGQYPIAHDLEDPPAVALYFGLEHLGADGSDAREGAGFVALHMRRVAHHVCRQNYRQLPFHHELDAAGEGRKPTTDMRPG